MNPTDTILRDQLVDRRRRLEAVGASSPQAANLRELLHSVDRALAEMGEGAYGLCKVCHEPIESERLLADPLVQVCLSHLTTQERRELEADLQLASQIQKELLPKQNLRHAGWEAAHHYEPAGVVSGDYCDFLTTSPDRLCFMVGDVSGKGVAASMLMGQLHALLRTLFSLNLTLSQTLGRASRGFCESTLPMHFATLICGRAHRSGKVEFCNAGHLPPLLLRNNSMAFLESSGLPVGLFCSEEFSQETVQLDVGESLVLFTDGLTEAEDEAGHQYGLDRLMQLLKTKQSLPAAPLLKLILSDWAEFRKQRPKNDDLTLMVIQRAE